MKRIKKPKKLRKMKVYREDDSRGVNGPLIILLIILFVMSITLLAFGFLKTKKPKVSEVSEEDFPSQEEESEDLGSYYDQAFSKNSSGEAKDEVYLQNDPFKKECESTSGDGQPAISFGTVCYR